MNKAVRISINILAVILITIIALIGALNLAAHIAYAPYYKIQDKICSISGLSEGFVPQGTTFDDSTGTVITSGYMVNDCPSRIYRTDPKTNSYTFYSLMSNGEPFFGHTGGIQYSDGKLYLADEGTGLYIFDAKLPEGESIVDIGSPVKMNNHTSFVFADKTGIYVGEFNNDKEYQTENVITYKGKTQRAIVEKFSFDNLIDPEEVYSIPNLAQGFAITDEGSIVISTSYGLSSSKFLVYYGDEIKATGRTYFGAPLYFLDEPSAVLTAPPMSEDLDVVDGKLIYLSESASSKYFFGKLLFNFYVNTVDIDNAEF